MHATNLNQPIGPLQTCFSWL